MSPSIAERVAKAKAAKLRVGRDLRRATNDYRVRLRLQWEVRTYERIEYRTGRVGEWVVFELKATDTHSRFKHEVEVRSLVPGMEAGVKNTSRMVVAVNLCERAFRRWVRAVSDGSDNDNEKGKR